MVKVAECPFCQAKVEFDTDGLGRLVVEECEHGLWIELGFSVSEGVQPTYGNTISWLRADVCAPDSGFTVYDAARILCRDAKYARIKAVSDDSPYTRQLARLKRHEAEYLRHQLSYRGWCLVGLAIFAEDREACVAVLRDRMVLAYD